MEPINPDSFDDFLLRQQQRFRHTLQFGEQRVRDRKADLDQFDVEVRKQPGTMSCVSNDLRGAHDYEPGR